MNKVLVIALISLAACSSTNVAPCRYDSSRVGERTSRFVNGVANFPSYLADHVANRSWRMGASASLLAQQTAQDANATAHNFTTGLWSLTQEEAARVQNINGWLDRRAEEE